ncbi:MFS general substrate transporter [Annulohypoxylon truncatum]|uniref:MFS general substrate transporter n=1 Tax=Annulohypoxylon truncatum TaxID=327061 RepID=UPI002008CE3A|nr:MFS general substrate transporter [Annulohypoxylon truncatum]KAI1211243.1 MFS general substrate transporter [Annulohypoxylon truncatum]
MTFTLLGDVILGTLLTLVADRLGRRRIMIGGSLMMILSGVIFALFENFWILLLAAVIGVISVTGGDFGPFRSIEESMISQLTTPATRADVLSWHVTIALFGSSLGSELSGRILHFLQNKDGWSDVDAYHTLFWVYAIMGVVNLGLVLLLSDACELSQAKKTYTQVPQEDTVRNTNDGTESPAEPPPEDSATDRNPQNWIIRSLKWFSNQLAQISPTTRSVMYKLWFLLAVDSLADGMVPYSLTNYYMNEKFHPRKSTLGDVTSFSYFLGAISASFAGPLARKIGLINTMVFTHTPSSTAVLLFPFPPYLWMTAGLLLVRAGLNNMDQAPRAAFIAAVVKPEERTAVMGITATVRTLAATTGPTVTGLLAASERFWIAFVAAGCFRLSYDFGLYAMFVNMKINQHENKPVDLPSGHDARRIPDEEMELESLADTVDTDSGSEDSGSLQLKPDPVRLEVPDGNQRIRSRSPRRERYIDS